MLVVILSWSYYFFLCFMTGVLLEKGIAYLLKRSWKFKCIDFLVVGIVGITIYASFFSLFYKLGMVAHLILVIVTVIAAVKHRKTAVELFHKCKKKIFTWEVFFYLCIILLIAFFTSRGNFHTDTNIYHAQNIRLYEEYGIIKGMANLQLHYGYNSLYLAFVSILSLSWLLPWSLHTTTGFIEMILCIYAFSHLKNFKKHKFHLEDAGCIGILGYTLINITGSMSPATDYPTMFLSIYMIAVWLRAIEKRSHYDVYGLLSLFGVFLGTMKLSAIAMVTVVLYPAYYLLRNKEWKKIIYFLISGIMIILPYLLRNIILSGWLVYPFEKIDLFHVEWKVPLEYLLKDANQIKVWGRCLFDVNMIDLPIKEWFPIWIENQERYALMFMVSCVFGGILAVFNLCYKLLTPKQVRIELVVLYIGIFVSVGMWFFMAPFIRYGLSFLLMIPLISMASWLDYEKKGFQSLATGGLVFLIMVCFCPCIDHYITDMGVFIKQRIKEPYYIVAKDYDTGTTGIYTINNNILYYNDYKKEEGERNSYHYFPNTAYLFMLERTTLAGDEIRDGFIPK